MAQKNAQHRDVRRRLEREGADVPSVRDLDVIFRETDHLYYEVARGCGLSNAAYWSLVSVVISGGTCTQAEIADDYAYSRQTVNSAVKSLVAKGYVTMDYADGSHRSKAIRLTEEGEVFCRQSIYPAVDAECRAFESLSPEERIEFVRLVRRYTDAIDGELGRLNEGAGGEDA